MNIPIIMEILLQEQATTLYILYKMIQNKFQLVWDKSLVGALRMVIWVYYKISNKIAKALIKAN